MESLSRTLKVTFKRWRKARVFPRTFGFARKDLDRIDNIHCIEFLL